MMMMMMMMTKKKALGSSRSFFAGGSAWFGTVALSFKLSWFGGELLAAAVAETSLRSYFLALLLLFLLPDR